MTQKGFSIFELLRQSTANPKLASAGGEEHGFVDGHGQAQQRQKHKGEGILLTRNSLRYWMGQPSTIFRVMRYGAAAFGLSIHWTKHFRCFSLDFLQQHWG